MSIWHFGFLLDTLFKEIIGVPQCCHRHGMGLIPGQETSTCWGCGKERKSCMHLQSQTLRNHYSPELLQELREFKTLNKRGFPFYLPTTSVRGGRSVMGEFSFNSRLLDCA